MRFLLYLWELKDVVVLNYQLHSVLLMLLVMVVVNQKSLVASSPG